uniref:Uncharacterized protein n=1 Tax=Vitrella brassicaformis TaxID=1169539 RepID=A0A7S1P8S8_9ALVE
MFANKMERSSAHSIIPHSGSWCRQTRDMTDTVQPLWACPQTSQLTSRPHESINASMQNPSPPVVWVGSTLPVPFLHHQVFQKRLSIRDASTQPSRMYEPGPPPVPCVLENSDADRSLTSR